MVKQGLSLVLLVATALMAQPGRSAPVRDQQWSTYAARLFPALTALEKGQGAALPGAVLAVRRTRLDACQHVPGCMLRAAIWTEAEMAEVADLANRALDASQHRGVAADDGIRAQVRRELKGLNVILQVYGLGVPPRYPQIDGPIDPPGSAQFNATLADALMLAEAGFDDPNAVLDPSMAIALALLDVNNGDAGITFEPLDQEYNAPGLTAARSIDWKRYRYTAIVVPGVGPTELATPLSARGKLNVRMAARRFTEGLAPFIIVSGSGVHPRGTAFVEAVEMRKALMERYGVPAERILIEPYARHTTTNLRNVSRRLIAIGAPLDRDALIITNVDQSKYIESAEFKIRNDTELGYQPGAIGARPSPVELAFRPSAASSRIDPADPLDP